MSQWLLNQAQSIFTRTHLPNSFTTQLGRKTPHPVHITQHILRLRWKETLHRSERNKIEWRNNEMISSIKLVLVNSKTETTPEEKGEEHKQEASRKRTLIEREEVARQEEEREKPMWRAEMEDGEER